MKPMSFSIGADIGAYTITGELGKGGMATVYKARHNKLERDVAIKVMHPTYSGESTFIRRFEREARVVARLEHPHIVPVYDYATHEGHPYLVMRYIEGETLKDRLNEGNLSTREILRLTDAIADALDYAHGEGVLHRDIKPSNILLTAGRGVYITDFGLARVMQSGESTLSQGMIMGTPHYISPEQAKGVAELDGRADIYSYGVILYEMATGRVPFRAESDFSIIHSQIFDAPPLPSMINDAINPRLEMLLLKVLEKEPDARYDTAGEMAAALHHALDDMPSSVTPAGKPALTDYTPVAMTKIEMDAPVVPEKVPVTAVIPPETVIAPADETPEPPTPIAPPPESDGGKKRGGKKTAVLIGGGIVAGIAICICLLLALAAMSDDGTETIEDEIGTALETAVVATIVSELPPVLQTPASAELDMPTEPPPPEQGGDADTLFAAVGDNQLRPLEELIAMADERPDDRVLMTELALSHLEAGDWDSAVALVEQRFADVRTPAPFVRTAEVLLENGRVDLAYIVLEEAMYKFADTPRLLSGGGVQRMLLMLNIWYADPDGVRTLYEQLENNSSKANDALASLADAYLLAVVYGDVESAEEILLLATEDGQPYRADAYFLLGMLYDETELYDEAYSSWEQALEANPPGWMRILLEYILEE